MARRLHVAFIEPMAVSGDELRVMLGYAQKSDTAWNQALWKFLHLTGIKRIPGTSCYPKARCQRAIEQTV